LCLNLKGFFKTFEVWNPKFYLKLHFGNLMELNTLMVRNYVIVIGYPIWSPNY
jgi:hypothetical protein